MSRDGLPLSGVVVLLLDSAANVAGRALSNDGGQFRIVAPRAGAFRLRALRIGFLPVTGEPLTLSPAREATRRLVLADLPIVLDTTRVTNRSICANDASSSQAAFGVWDQARTALTAAELTAESRALRTTSITYRRSLDPTLRRIDAERATITTETVARPWGTLSPDSLHAAGYVAADPGGDSIVYYAPGLDALTSPLFVEDHCFRLSEPADSSRLEIAFEPSPARRRFAEVRGVLRLDRRTLRLIDLEYHYANTDRQIAEHAGGKLEFAALAGGGWIISSWSIQMPVLAAPAPSAGFGRSGSSLGIEPVTRHVAAIDETGGVVSTVARGSDTLWVHPGIRLAGTVRDSLTGAPVPGAQVRVDRLGAPAVTDHAGRFVVAGVVPGSHELDVRAPSLDSLGVAVDAVSIVFDTDAAITVRVPDARRLAAALAARAGRLAGVVLSDSTSQPIAGAEVSLVDLGLSTRADERGQFRLDRIPPGEHRLAVRSVGFAPLDQQIAFKPNTVVNRRVLLDRVVRLDSMVVEASSSAIPEFEENRKLGLGHFITRDELAKRETSHLSEILETIPSVRILRKSNSTAAFAVRARGKLSVFSTGAQDADGECYADVFLDGNPVYQKKGSGDGEKFDLNSISPGQIEAIEYYAGPAETPAKYSGLNSTCGVLVIWTRRSP